MPDMPSPEVKFLNVVAVNGEIVTLFAAGQEYRARGYPNHPLKEKDVVRIINRDATAILVNRIINGRLDSVECHLIFDVA
jgi:hypothetical protein